MPSRLAVGVFAGPMTASSFIVDDAIVGLAQPLTEALNQLASDLRRAYDLIEELGRREDFYLDLTGGSSGRTAGAVFHNAHLANQLPCANRAEKDGVPVEFPEYVDRTAQQAKNTVRRISLPEQDLPFGEVRASHCGPLDSVTKAGEPGIDLPIKLGMPASTPLIIWRCGTLTSDILAELRRASWQVAQFSAQHRMGRP
jgi:hypothetical protein